MQFCHASHLGKSPALGLPHGRLHRVFDYMPVQSMTKIDETLRLTEATSKRSDWPEAVKQWQAVLDNYGPRAPKKFRARLWRAQQALSSEEALRKNRLLFKALADPAKVIWVAPQEVRYKVPRQTDIKLYSNAILPGDCCVAICDTIKYQSVEQHFAHGIDWEDTHLFRRKYADRIGRGEIVRGCITMTELKGTTVDALYKSMKQRGFLLPEDGSRSTGYIPHVHIGRRGEILYGRAGNHRLAIAKILKLDRLACLVRARHAEWQELRENLFRNHSSRALGPELAHHPDLADLVK